MFEDGAVELFCNLIAASCHSFEPSALSVNCQDTLAFLRKIGAVQRGEPPSVAICGACDDNHSAQLQYDPELQRYWHFCPEAGRVDVADASLETLRVDREWAVRWLIEALPIVLGRHRVLVPDLVWSLGDIVVGQAEIAVVFATRASTGADLRALADAIRTVHPAKLGLVITTSAAPTSSLSLPNGFHVLDLRDIARVKGDQLVIGQARLAGWVKGFRSGRSKPTRSGPGRPSERDLVKEIARKRRDDAQSHSVRREEARAIQTEFSKRYPGQPVPAVKTIEKHLRVASR